MGTFGGSLWGGGGGGGAPSSVGTPLSGLIMPAYRIAGITQRAMITPNDDMFSEAIPELNRMIGSWNCARPKIFTIRVDAFPITGGQKVFTVGAGLDADGLPADFPMPRPQAIQNGVIILGAGTAGVVRMPPMHQMDDQEWARVSLQDVPNGVPLGFYFDGSYDPATGWSLIYMWPQTLSAYQVEWYTWQSLPTFTTKTDTVALPPGYESAIVFGLATRLAALNPHMAKMDPAVYEMARAALATLESKNAPTPNMTSDFGSKGGGHWDFRVGFSR